MTYAAAKKLHKDDEVMVKNTGEILSVVSITIFECPKVVEVLCDDGSEYHHCELF